MFSRPTLSTYVSPGGSSPASSSVSSSIRSAASSPNVEKKLVGSSIAATLLGSQRRQWRSAAAPYWFIVRLLCVRGRTPELIEGELVPSDLRIPTGSAHGGALLGRARRTRRRTPPAAAAGAGCAGRRSC